MPKVIIAGGGVHGTFLSHALTRTRAVHPEDVTVTDPHPEPLAVWYRQTDATGMSHLRSPSSHNLDLDFHALRAYARRRGTTDDGGSTGGLFIPPYARPALRLFNEHAREVVDRYALSSMRQVGRLVDVDAGSDSVSVRTDSDVRSADYLILAVGRTEMPHRPAWARAAAHERIVHVFDRDFTPEIFQAARAPTVVVGGGVTGVQVACHAARRTNDRVVLLSRAPLRVEQFDSEPCYIGPRCLETFLATGDAAQRRRFIREARSPGTIPPDVGRGLAAEPRVEVIEDEAVGVEADAEGVRVRRQGSAKPVRGGLLVLATGFQPRPPLSPIVRGLARRHRLPVGPAGYPVPDVFLRWHPRVLVAGPLGELELGPAAPNIIGAHLAARRLVPFFRGDAAGASIAWTALTHYLETV
jgi:thioredoxin reductase